MLSVGVGITWFLVLINIVGILPRPGSWRMGKRAEDGVERAEREQNEEGLRDGEREVTLSTY
jgi:hypothetical protein